MIRLVFAAEVFVQLVLFLCLAAYLVFSKHSEKPSLSKVGTCQGGQVPSLVQAPVHTVDPGSSDGMYVSHVHHRL